MTSQDRNSRLAALSSFTLEHGVATTAELARLFDVSVMTIHRDIDELARRGVLRKFHGGVTARASTVFESVAEFRASVNVDKKRKLAAVALSLIEPGMSLLLDDSTTVLELARLLAKRTPLTVISNYRRTLNILADCDDVKLIAIGGEYSTTHDSFMGLFAEEQIASLHADLVIQSTSAMTTSEVFHQEPEVARMKRRMLDAGDRKILLMDSSKIGRSALYKLCDLGEIDELVVSRDTPKDSLDSMRADTSVRLA